MKECINEYEVIIIGGSYSGLSAAMALGRSLRKVLIIDHNQPSNKTTPHSHNFLTQDGKTPTELTELAKKQVLVYPGIQIKNDEVISCTPSGLLFEVQTKSEDSYFAKKILFATGVKDLLPDIPGLAACWGKSVIHCPYCHGYEFHRKPTGIYANGDAAIHHAQLVSNLTGQLSIFTNGPSNFTSEQADQLTKNKIKVIEQPIVEIQHNSGHINHLIMEDGSTINIDALYVRAPFEQHCPIPQSMGCQIDEHGFISVNNMQETSIKGVFASGDNSSGMRSIANAVATGNVAGAIINKQLCDERYLKIN